MHINSINITNFQGLHHAALVVSDPLLLVSGGNGAGKSSLLDAIAMAFDGKPRRVSLKKDLGQLISEGTKKGSVSLATSEGEFTMALPTGKGVQLVDQPFLPFVLDASRFTAIDGKERRKLLFELTGASANPKVVAQRLAERGARPDLIEKVKPLLLSGFPAAADQAREFASQARGAWKALTGENYGSDKAEGWEPELPEAEATPEDLTAAKKAHDQLQQDLDEATETLGACKAKAQQAEADKARIVALNEQVALLDRRRAKVDRDSKELAEWTDKRDAAKEAASGKKEGLVHDLARTLQAFEDLTHTSDGFQMKGETKPWSQCEAATSTVEVLEQYRSQHGAIGEQGDAELAGRLQEFQGYVYKLTTALTNSKRDVAQSEAASATIAEIEQAASTAPAVDAIKNAQQQITELRQQRDAASAKVEALTELMTARAQHAVVKRQAGEHHELVKAWGLIAEALAPTGIPAEILAAALTPVNDVMRDLAAVAGWKETRINGDIELTYGERLHGLLSESEKWRAEALLSIAIAKLSGLRFVTLDRFDVLEPKARPQALKLLMTALKTDVLDQAIMAGTMKEPMGKVPAGIQQVWIDHGVVNEAAAAAA